MAKSVGLGNCEKRSIKVADNQICDWFEPKRKSGYKVACRNCGSFHKIPLDDNKKKKSNKE